MADPATGDSVSWGITGTGDFAANIVPMALGILSVRGRSMLSRISLVPSTTWCVVLAKAGPGRAEFLERKIAKLRTAIEARERRCGVVALLDSFSIFFFLIFARRHFSPTRDTGGEYLREERVADTAFSFPSAILSSGRLYNEIERDDKIIYPESKLSEA